MANLKYKNSLHIAILVLAGAFLYTALLHAKLGMDGFWDTANYHLYIGWAASELIPYRNGAIAQYHTFLNPLIDVLNYKTFSAHPFLGALVHSIVFSVAILISYLIFVQVTASTQKTSKPTPFALMAVAIGATGAMSVSLFGSFTNEHFTALLILWALYLAVKHHDSQAGKTDIFIGVLAGLAVGLKLTATPYLLALGLTTAAIPNPRSRKLLYFACGAAVGLAIADGPFMVLRWYEFGNPVFPLANNIFKSPYYPPEWKSFSQFEPARLFYYLSLPVRWLYSGDLAEGGASNVRDGRLFLAHLGLALFALAAILKREWPTRREAMLILFFLFSWIFWILILRIYRYLVVLELLAGVIFLAGCVKVLPAQKRWPTVIIIASSIVFLLATTVYPSWGRRPWDAQFVQVNSLDALASGKIVLFSDQRQSYLAPFLKERHIVFASLHAQPWFDGDRQGSPIDKAGIGIPSVDDVVFLQYSKDDPRVTSAYLRRLAEDMEYECNELKTNMLWSPNACRYRRSKGLIEPLAVGTKYGHTADKIRFAAGWSEPEKAHRWSEGRRSSLSFMLPQRPDSCPFQLFIDGETHGNQEFGVSVNGVELLRGKYSGAFSIGIPLDEPLGSPGRTIKLDFDLPNAFMPANGDTRMLAIAFHHLSINCQTEHNASRPGRKISSPYIEGHVLEAR